MRGRMLNMQLQATLLGAVFLPMAAAFTSPAALPLRRSASLAISHRGIVAGKAPRGLPVRMMATTGTPPPSGVAAGKAIVSNVARFAPYLVDSATGTIPIDAIAASEYDGWLEKQDESCKGWISAMGFSVSESDSGKTLVIPGGASGVSKVLLIVGDSDGYGPMYSFAGLPSSLPKKAGTFELTSLGGCDPTQAALGFALGAYAFDTYKGTSKPSSETSDNKFATIVWPEGADRSYVQKTSEATFLVRDLISTPSEDMGPNALQAAAEALAALHSGATVSSIVGDDLLKENYPQIHAVGRAAGDKHAPRLIEIRWGKGKGGKKVAIVGKGVTFDTGGLDIKPASAMGKMKKDMGGAAEVLGLAHMIMGSDLNVDLHVLLAVAENSISGNSFRPGDILRARNGLTSEIGNTDAEGRLVLADALVAACEESPDLVIDCATLTGAGRVALGTDVPAVFVNNDELAMRLQRHSEEQSDLTWRLPLFKGYAKMLDSKIADMSNIGSSPYGGAITAALYLQKFITQGTDWIHVDFMAYNTGSRPGRPEGGEAMGMRALFATIKERCHK